MTDTALVLARFALPTRGVLAAVQRALAAASHVMLVLRDAHAARSQRHPFPWHERADMLRECLAPADVARVTFVPQRERFDERRTLLDLQALCAGTAGEVHVIWAGAHDALLAPVLETRTRWRVASAGCDDELQAMRERLFEAEDAAGAARAIEAFLPRPLRDTMAARLARADYPRLRAEALLLASEKAHWASVPYPVTLVTVDALVRCADHVLLVRRGRHPGQGLYAVPGGFLEEREPIRDAALRELREETGIEFGDDEAHRALHAAHVFEHPDRSQRGRVVTHAFCFDLGRDTLPPVVGGDDAADARWVPLRGLPALEEQLLDDHFHILDHFLGLRAAGTR